MSEELRGVLDFVEGRLTVRQFEALLYTNLERFKAFFGYEPNPPSSVTDIYLYLIVLDYGNPDDVVKAQDALIEYLARNGINFKATPQHRDLSELLHEVQPDWLDVDPVWLQEAVLPEAGNRDGDELKEWLSHRLLKLFQYRIAPPSWLQSPEWPIGPNGPLLFLGALDTEDYLGHSEVFYVFYDMSDGQTTNVMQAV